MNNVFNPSQTFMGYGLNFNPSPANCSENVNMLIASFNCIIAVVEKKWGRNEYSKSIQISRHLATNKTP